MSATLLFSLGIFPAILAAGDELRVTLTVDFGKDEGQNFGSLFELGDEKGNVRAGAGFLGAYNTQPRSSRRTLHFFVKPDPEALYDGNVDVDPDNFRLTALPRPTTDTGVYLYDFKGRLYAISRNGPDNRLRFWDPKSETWRIDPDTPPHAIEIANGVMQNLGGAITWNGESIYETHEGRLTIGEPYYANGFLFFREFWKEQSPWINAIIAVPWSPESPGALDESKAIRLKLRTVNEFIYGWGQLGEKVIVSTNTGGNYDFDGKAWRTLIEPDQTTSFQVYSIMNYYDRLRMGQYPTGNLFEYDGKEMRLMKGEPPVLAPAVDRAREAQTLAIYRGDVYCGVWPWAEVWRFDPGGKQWSFAGRMFDHPKISSEFRHPYEAQMQALGEKVWNLWGQRITSLVPMGDSLYIGTSSKGSAAWDPKFDFLAAGEKWRDYGKVYRLTAPGHLSVRTKWTGGPTKLEFQFGEGKMTVLQDGEELGSSDVWIGKMPAPERIEWGQGIYGTLRGRILSYSNEPG